MDTEVLVKSDRDMGWELLEELQNANFPIKAAFWRYLPDAEKWRLVLATPLVDEVGSNAAYTRLQELINQSENQDIQELFSVSNITLISPTSDIVTRLKKRYGSVEIDRRRIRRLSLSSEEAYIYFLE